MLTDPLREAAAALLTGPRREADLVLALAGAGGLPLAPLVQVVTECADAGGVVVIDGEARPLEQLLRAWPFTSDAPLDGEETVKARILLRPPQPGLYLPRRARNRGAPGPSVRLLCSLTWCAY